MFFCSFFSQVVLVIVSTKTTWGVDNLKSYPIGKVPPSPMIPKMQAELRQRLEKLRIPTLMRMRENKGPCELVSWWERFIKDIPDGAGFADLDRQKQNLILSWEKEISAKIGTVDKKD
jgi:hypothetical protein